jgi:hypothetical protein
MKTILLSFFLFGSVLLAYGQGHTTITDIAGYWNDNALWTSGAAPGQNVGEVTIVESTVAAAIDGAKVVIPNNLNNGDLSVTDRLTVNGFLIIEGNLTFSNHTELSIGPKGILIVRGNFTASPHLDVASGGLLIINGAITWPGNENQGSFENDGEFYSKLDDTKFSGDDRQDFSQLLANYPDLWAIAIGIGVTPLPVELLYFRSSTTSQGVQLEWASAKEWDFSHYTLERSDNGEDYTPIHVAYVHGDSYTTKEYRYTDHQPQYGANYYRLKTIDINGSEEYKGVVLAYSGTKGELEVRPNPATAENINLRYLGASEGTWLSVLTSTGSEVIRLEMKTYDLRLPSLQIPKGLYIVKVQNQFESRQARLIIH